MIEEAVQAGTAIASTIAAIGDMNKRRRFEEQLALLSNNQQKQLNERLLQANSDNARLQILSSSMVEYAVANQRSQASKDTVLYIIASALAVVILTTAVVYAVKIKKS